MVQNQLFDTSSIAISDGSRTPSTTIMVNNLMNTNVTAQDSLYHICVTVKRRLESLSQLKPYLNLAYSSSELLCERQSLLLSQKQQQQKELGHQSLNSTFGNNTLNQRDSHNEISLSNGGRSSTISSSSMKDDTSLDGVTYAASSGLSSVQSTSNPNSGHNGNIEDTLLTFSMGILPITENCDPVTQLSQLFQQGSPLCIIFNSVQNQVKLPVVSSDDLKICKKSIYDFILGCKQHLAFIDEELFTISDVFGNSTSQLMKVLDVVITLMDSAPDVFPSTISVLNDEANFINESQNSIKKFESYSKIMKEFVATERKYVFDLEILEKYRQQLLESNLITSEELYMLFPNLSEAIDFQRRFLVSLEINAKVDPSKQRVGALFMHSKYFFKLYEPWSIGQNAAIDFLSNNLERLQDTDFVIKNKLELQSFLYKPVQRLCRYPLLLKELLQSSNLSNNPKELEMALDIAKSIARSINDNQRRTENHEVVKKLYNRVVNWKGYRIAKFGELLYYDKIFISTSNSSESEKEFEVYLFEKIIILFSEVTQKKSSSLSLKKKPTTSSLSLSLTSSHSSSANQNNDGVNEPKLDLRGRILIMNLNKINPQGTHTLNITWESPKEQGNFILKFKNEETRDNWSSCLQSLVRNIRSESFRSTSSTGDRSSLTSPIQHKQAHNSMASINSSHVKRISDMQQKNRTSSFGNEYRSISENYKSSIPDSSLLIRIAFNSDFYTILIELDASIDELLQTIKKKISHSGTVTKIKYQDEDGDYVILESEDDWIVAKDMLKENNDQILNVWAYA
ncbi:hypothetical protein Kpol_367p2 [Vanderwaltozyma polyspora DSM 70294]|uniref:DH domain-containing protein n=1 Tax=Vanderwaltozyma polyspora (strain ATCC 22028 / DSM 70294 / BCRC 21397 / CBS 2163 / NBRC 10782 / NRRL Y-8283 / UCD 57-17) TaxID=436907 RepID=A7TRQ3_VANPO|nr:uncharacterized protein Kpol_367p2 [Vanderwaltozyma polyspora DSM 70294]EDO15047.1 hypothetical protein Kpol_367p2 [Vanderwaltozyma polyspora DSM 70294]